MITNTYPVYAQDGGTTYLRYANTHTVRDLGIGMYGGKYQSFTFTPTVLRLL